jgi:hypothetical protein
MNKTNRMVPMGFFDFTMAKYIKEISRMDNDRVGEPTRGQMNKNTRASGSRIVGMEEGHTRGRMGAKWRVNGKKATCMERYISPGPMERRLMALVKWERRTEEVSVQEEDV